MIHNPYKMTGATSITWIAALAVSGMLGGLASILLRLAALTDGGASAAWVMRGVAICIYGLGFLTYAFALRKVNLSVAYPLMVSLSVFVVFIFTYFHEHTLRPAQILGAILLIVSITLISRGG